MFNPRVDKLPLIGRRDITSQNTFPVSPFFTRGFPHTSKGIYTFRRQGHIQTLATQPSPTRGEGEEFVVSAYQKYTAGAVAAHELSTLYENVIKSGQNFNDEW